MRIFMFWAELCLQLNFSFTFDFPLKPLRRFAVEFDETGFLVLAGLRCVWMIP